MEDQWGMPFRRPVRTEFLDPETEEWLRKSNRVNDAMAIITLLLPVLYLIYALHEGGVLFPGFRFPDPDSTRVQGPGRGKLQVAHEWGGCGAI